MQTYPHKPQEKTTYSNFKVEDENTQNFEKPTKKSKPATRRKAIRLHEVQELGFKIPPRFMKKKN